MELISFEEAIAVRPAGEGVFRAETHPSWDALLTTHGGLLAAIAIRAIDAAVDPVGALQLRSLTCHFLRPPHHGELDVRVETLRSGRRMTFSRATLVQEDRPFMSVQAIHSARDLPEAIRFQPPPPDVPAPPLRDAGFAAPEEYRRGAGLWLRYDERAPKFLQNLLGAPQFGHPPFMGPEEIPPGGTENGGWAMPRDPQPVDAALLAVYGDLYWPSVLQPLRTPATAPTLDLTVHFRAGLPNGGLPDQPVLIHNTTVASLDGTVDSDSRVFAADGTLLAQARQLQLLSPA